jgi:hypothetical protein
MRFRIKVRFEIDPGPGRSRKRYLFVEALFVEAGDEVMSSDDLLQPTKNAANVKTQTNNFFIPKSLLIN